MTKTTLKTAILSFAFSGVLAQHRNGYEAPRPVSQAPHKGK
jgi:hypothetical protein